MKTKINLLLLIVSFLFCFSSYAQQIAGKNAVVNATPSQKSVQPSNEIQAVSTLMNYQAVARNSVGAILANQLVGLRLSIEDGPGGTVLYSERQTPTTNQFGLLTVKLGGGTVLSGTWSAIVWSNGGQWLKVDMDPTGGSSYTPMGESELLTVPFANYSAATAAVNGTTNYVSKFTSPNTLGNSMIYDNGSDRIGVGTGANANYYPVSIYANNDPVVGFTNSATTNNSGDGTLVGLEFGAPDFYIWNFENASIYFATQGNERMRVTGAGNVGIGTATPLATALLQTEAGAYATGITTRSLSNTTGAAVTTLLGGLYPEVAGLYSKVTAGPATGISYGLVGETSANAEHNLGVASFVSGTSSGNAYSFYGDVTGGTNYTLGAYLGAHGSSGVSTGADAEVGGTGTTNYGFYAYVSGATTNNYGVYSQAVGTGAFAGFFSGKVNVNGQVTSNFDYQGFNMHAQHYLQSTLPYPALSFIGSSGTTGVEIELDGANQFGVYDTTGITHGQINASAFNVVSDRRLKNSIVDVTPAEYESYLQQIRNIESATYFYNNEQRDYKHVGFIAQSLPKEAVMVKKDTKPGQPENMMMYNLSDMTGINTIGIKALDSEVNSLKAEIADLKAEIARLKK